MTTPFLNRLEDHMIVLRDKMQHHVASEPDWYYHKSDWVIEFDRLIAAYAAATQVYDRAEQGYYATQQLTMQVEHNEKRAAMPWWRFW